MDRVRMQRTIDTARAICAATTHDPLGEEWADAQAQDASEVAGIHEATNLARASARLAAMKSS